MNGNSLGTGNADTDLVVAGGTCMVNGGTYMYRNINIVKGGVLQFTDAPITLYAANIIIENEGTMRAGSVDPNTGVITPITGPLEIRLYGANQGLGGIGASCKTDATCGVPVGGRDGIWKKNNTMTMYPDSCKETKGLPGGVDDCFYGYDAMPFDNGKPTDSTFDQPFGYYGYKAIGVGYGATLQLYGKKGATYDTTVDPTNTGMSWARLNNCDPNVTDSGKKCTKGVLQPGADTLVLSKAVDWKLGDNIVIASTDYLPGHAEQVKISCVNDMTDCPGTMKFTPALKFPHDASRYSLSKVTGGQKPTGWTSVDTRASVALLTRSIRIVSWGDTIADPFPDAPTPPITPATQGYYFGGHMVIRQGFEKVQIQGVEFYQMGQGGRVGHYPVHFHMARRVPTSTFLKDNSVWDSMTRWYVLHATQGVLLARNVGYASIGHGYYFEDGTETDNKLYANIGVFARAAVTNIQNPRNVPGILAAPDYPIINRPPENGGPLQTGPSDDVVPYHSDWDHPTVFWVMNAWNDFENNMAAGAGTCGVCYWMLPGINSGMSRNMNWNSYASEQQLPDAKTQGGTTPLQIFTGNSCVSAMSSFLTVANTTACNGVQIGPNRNNASFPVLNQSVVTDPMSPNYNLAPSSKDGTKVDPRTGLSADNYYPHLGGGGRFPTRCTAMGDCSKQKVCSTDTEANCVITNIDHYTSSFNWQATNFAAVWLRPLWYLFINSALTDIQNGGITFVTGGGYTKSDAINGHWALARKDVFIGNTQDPAASSFASNVGPFNPGTQLKCKEAPDGGKPGNYCLDIDDGVAFALATFANNQRMFSIYDGPAYEDSNAYLDITRSSLPNDALKGCNPQQPDDKSPDHNCANSVYSQAGKMLGMPYDPINKVCYLPNAAIAWKQPNGFYYPPAFHSRDLFFDNVDIRHFVIEPLFKSTGLFVSDPVKSKARYRTYDASMFTGYTDIDRQTELNDDDGTLTGLVGPTAQTGLIGSVSVNQDPFFNAPLQTPECLSDVDVTPSNSVNNPTTYAGTAVTSPYDYVTTVVFPGCAASGAKCDQTAEKDAPWNADCTNQNCYGVPLYRENLISGEPAGMGVPIRLMGQANFQRSSLTVNNGRYYVDTSPSLTAQSQQSNVKLWNVFRKGGTYYVFLVFAKPTTKQTYDIYVGTGFDPSKKDQLWLSRVELPSSYEFKAPQPFPQDQVTYNKSTGILSVTLDMSKFPKFANEYAKEKENQCQPKTFCQWIDSPGIGEDNCQCAESIFSPPTPTFQSAECSTTKGICGWATKDTDCPKGGCYGFGVKLSGNFVTSDNPPTPAPQNVACLTKPLMPPPSPYDVSWTLTTNSSACNYSSTNPALFCSNQAGLGPDDPGTTP